jgi:hypothetical protein
VVRVAGQEAFEFCWCSLTVKCLIDELARNLLSSGPLDGLSPTTRASIALLFEKGRSMNSPRMSWLVLVATLVCAPLPAQAQGGPPSGGGNLAERVAALEALVTTLQTKLTNEATARAAADSTLQTNINSENAARATADGTLQTQIDKLNGNITAADLEGTYNLYMIATSIEDCCGPTTLTSYVVNGTMTFGTGGTGQLENTVATGQQLMEQLPSQNWLLQSASESGGFDGSFSWVYNNGVVTINAAGDINDFTPTAGGQVMLGVQGGAPGNNQIMFVLTRQPSN